MPRRSITRSFRSSGRCKASSFGMSCGMNRITAEISSPAILSCLRVRRHRGHSPQRHNRLQRLHDQERHPARGAVRLGQLLEGLRVMNGTLSGFSDEGIYLQAGGRGVVENMRVMSSAGAGVAPASISLIVARFATARSHKTTWHFLRFQLSDRTEHRDRQHRRRDSPRRRNGDRKCYRGKCKRRACSHRSWNLVTATTSCSATTAAARRSTPTSSQLHPNVCEPACP